MPGFAAGCAAPYVSRVPTPDAIEARRSGGPVVLARRLTTWTALSVIALATAGCGLFGGASDDLPDGVVSIAVAAPAHLLPSNVSDSSGTQVLSALFTPLVTYNSQHEPVEAAAQSITSTDNRTWTIELADGYTFHNGEKVTAQSYVDAWNYAAYGPHKQRNSYLFERIDGFAELQGTQPPATELTGLRPVDTLTFTVTLSAPFIDFPVMLGHPAFFPLPTTAFASPGVLDGAYENAVVGQGPFRMTGTWDHGDRIDVQRYDAAVIAPKVTGIRFQVYADMADAYADVVDGALDVVANIPPDKLTDARTDLGERLRSTPGSSMTMLAFPSIDPAFDQPAVRRAISMAIDRDALVASLFPGSQTAAHSFVPPQVVGYRADGCGTACTFDPVAARAAYAEADGPSGFAISYNADGGHQGWIEAVCAQLATNLGVDCHGFTEPTFSDLLAKVRASKSEGLFRMSWFMDYPSMESYLGPLFTSDGSSNFETYRSQDLDAAVRSGTSATSPAAAVAGYRRAESVLARDMPVVPLRFSVNNTGHSERVSGVTLDIFDRVDVTEITLG
jgi:oligopeptide transport system substrate-binding protein